MGKNKIEDTIDEIFSPHMLQDLQSSLCEITGMSFCAFSASEKPLTMHEAKHDFCGKYTKGSNIGIARCSKCDREAAAHVLETKEIYLYECHNGLGECIIPIVINDKVVGGFFGGQVMLDRRLTREEIYQKAEELGLDPEAYYRASLDVPVLSKKELEIKLHTVSEMLKVVTQVAYDEYKIKVESKEIERESRMKSDFLANMSHEIRTPMNAVIGMAEMALRDKLPQNTRDYVNQIQSAAKSLLAIINDILDFSKIESGKMDINLVDYEPLQLIHDVANVIETRVGKKNLEVLIDFDPEIPKVLMGDNIRIRQVIMNLANNAVKFTNSGKVTIKVTAVRSEKHTVIFRVYVEDTGIGIKQENLKKLFHSFSQLDSKRNRNVEGTGLGLVISKQLITLMNGRMSVQSEYNKGSVFYFEIPQILLRDQGPSLQLKNKPDAPVALYAENTYVSESLERDLSRLGVPCIKISDEQEFGDVASKGVKYIFVDEPVYTKSVKEFVISHPDIAVELMASFCSELTSEYPNLVVEKKPIYAKQIVELLNGDKDKQDAQEKKENVLDFIAPEARVLIVDDNEVNLTVAEGLMLPLQMTIDTVLSGADAIAKIAENQYDLIFMDHMMPGMDGVETTRIIRSSYPDYDAVPIIALTANAMEEARSLFLVEGMDDFIAKPIESEVLFSVIKQWLPKEKVRPVKNVKEVHVQEESDKLAKLRHTDGIDVDYSMQIVGSEELLWKVLRDYYIGINHKAQLIETAFDDEDWESYEVEVHALKSSSKMIGAVGLAELAKAQELATKNGQIHLVKKKHEKLLNSYLWYQSVLAPFVNGEDAGKQEDKPPMTKKVLEGICASLREAFDNLDMDEMENVVHEIEKYSLTEVENVVYKELRDAVEKLDVDRGEQFLTQWEMMI